MKKLTLVFTMLACMTAAAVQAQVQSHDARHVIWLSEAERALLLGEMRDFMSASQQVLAAALEQDMTTVETAARAMGMKLMHDTPADLSKRLPEGFTKLGPLAHIGFEDIADEASGLGDTQVILKRLAEMQKTCVACHAQYQFRVK